MLLPVLYSIARVIQQALADDQGERESQIPAFDCPIFSPHAGSGKTTGMVPSTKLPSILRLRCTLSGGESAGNSEGGSLPVLLLLQTCLQANHCGIEPKMKRGVAQQQGISDRAYPKLAALLTEDVRFKNRPVPSCSCSSPCLCDNSYIFFCSLLVVVRKRIQLHLSASYIFLPYLAASGGANNHDGCQAMATSSSRQRADGKCCRSHHRRWHFR